ncbi:uncharacterized protein AB675_8004 [Cyphellophora attinorum]|uniref:F-box domain-containing protein n=1 Tax=Cyphellophora attinorum TaxID=1664694 RepID=A0A0N0NND2_9EURO|nr:uncharacterized protein AB675_8004 [Phialophora attinorum]KPI41239.1 hypothetical protein AB675_8004 [Phialophora attinorum]
MAASGVEEDLVLPDEVLGIICDELGRDRDFVTLYRCAQASRSFADPALRTMYQYHEQSPAFLQSDEADPGLAKADFATKYANAEQAFQRWTTLWRSVIISSLPDSKTYKPYCRYLRMLDFRNLLNMVEDPRMARGKLQSSFFGGPMRPFKIMSSRAWKGMHYVDGSATINAVGESLTQAATQIEEIAGDISPNNLPRWIDRTPKLERLVLWNGNSLVQRAGQSVAKTCDHFSSLTIREWRNILPDDPLAADKTCAAFLNDLEPDTLEHFEIISYNDIAGNSFTALGRHKSLRDLTLNNLSRQAVENLNCLKDCTELQILVLEDNEAVQLEAANNDIFTEVVEWLRSCSKLRDLTLKRFRDGPAILSQVLVSPTVKLTKLSLEGYLVRDTSSRLFHTALSEQKTLEAVWLRGIGEDVVPDDLTIMVDGLSNIPHLKELVLKEVSDEFQEEHIMKLALSLPELEELWTSGDVVSADVLMGLRNLRNLKKLDLYAMTQFRSDEIIDFISQLDPVTQRGFQLSLMAADPNQGNLSETEQDLIRELIRTSLDGRFDFVLWRDADTSDSDSD